MVAIMKSRLYCSGDNSVKKPFNRFPWQFTEVQTISLMFTTSIVLLVYNFKSVITNLIL